jgi:hypothetical protein
MTTARTLVRKSLQKAGILTKNEQPSADEVNDGLDTLNDMLSSWSNETLLMYARVSESFAVSAGTASYTIGSGGTFSTVRPMNIASAYFRANSLDYPLTDISDTSYDDDITSKSQPGIPEEFMYVRNVPLGVITLFPVPSQAGTLHIRSEKVLTQMVLDDTVALPEGWEHAIVHNLAVILAPEYGQEASGTIVKEAGRSKAAIARTVARNRNMDTPPLTGEGGFDVLTGRWH